MRKNTRQCTAHSSSGCYIDEYQQEDNISDETILNSTIRVNSVSDLIQNVINLPNFSYARGESKKFSICFLPSISRTPERNKPGINLRRSANNNEMGILEAFRCEFLDGMYSDKYFQVFMGDEVLHQEISLSNPSVFDWAALAQHYGKPTRLVDITKDLLVALYFGVDGNPNHSGYVHIFNPHFSQTTKSACQNQIVINIFVV
jgi:hypothetical protein